MILEYKYNIHNQNFKTKFDCYKYTSKLVNSMKNISIDKYDEHFDYFVKLLDNHPDKHEKIKDGIKGFKFQKNPTYKHYQSFIITNNNDLVNFSFVRCCEFDKKSKKSDTEYNLINAMRTAIEYQTIEFKKNNKIICSLCKTITALEYHVDHNKPLFHEITTSFITQNTDTPLTFDKNYNYRLVFKDCDKIYKNKWCSYHKEMATLQILCKSCNLRKKKKL